MTRNRFLLRSICCLTIVLTAFSAGCNRRAHYRQEADREVDLLLQEAAETNPAYEFTGFDLQMDPRSRYFFDQADVEPAMPMDDPDASRYMKVVDGKNSWHGWEQNGITNEFENPAWREQLYEYVNTNEEGKIILDLETALTLAKMHSPTYQGNVETLYLSALDVSAERFNLDTQFFGHSIGELARTLVCVRIAIAVRRQVFRQTADDLLIAMAIVGMFQNP